MHPRLFPDHGNCNLADDPANPHGLESKKYPVPNADAFGTHIFTLLKAVMAFSGSTLLHTGVGFEWL
jgi:hypothetical protein